MKNSRERILALIVGSLAVFFVGFFICMWIYGRFDQRAKQIAQLTNDIRKFEKQADQGLAAARKIAQYEQRSLPANPELAKTRYQAWLINELEAAELIEPDVKAQQTIGSSKDLFIRQSFSVEASGNLPQVVELLHAFYNVDWLHRINELRLRPINDSKLLDITMRIETLSLPKAASVDKLEPRPSKRLALASRDAYYEAIVGRNFFGPRNNAPKISLSGPLDVFLGREAEVTFKGSDPDPNDQVYFSLVKSADPGAKIDPVTGKFTWKPTATGKFEFVVEGTDDGLPPKPAERVTFALNVKEQSSAPQNVAFDFAKFTMLSGLLDVDGKGEVWLNVRPTGQIVVLREGDRFEIGSVKGTVSQIGENDFCFDFEGKRRRLARGEMLDQAKPTGDVPQVASPAAPAATEVEVQAKADDKTS
jgi:hypothetical protein